MSLRGGISPPGREGSDLIRRLIDRIERLERGAATTGQVSLSESITIGGVFVEVTDDGAGGKTVTFRNPSNGVTSVIDLT